MERGLDTDLPLDYAAFQISPSQNRYEAFVCGEGRTERLASGLLENLVLHLSATGSFISDGSGDNLKLQLPESLRGSSWFTKSTISRFLHIVGEPELLKAANAIKDEILQLEEARRFHLTLYSQGQQNHSGSGATDSSYSRDTEPALKPGDKLASSDPTKNELLRAMDLRLTALRDELASAVNRAAGSTCSVKQIADLAAFAEHFGAVDLRNSLYMYLALNQKNQTADPVNEQPAFSHDSKNNNGKLVVGIAQDGLPVDTVKHSNSGVSPAKIAQAERQSSAGSDESSSSSDEDRSLIERSRPLIRSASPRRSASPMRRVQIGRSGSRRATALTIKSLSYFPPRERISSNRDAAGNSSGDEESDQPMKKAENTVRRMSVQDAINLFESKQRDQKSDTQKWRSSVETAVSTNKAVLRRWSAGMSDSSAQCLPENSSEGGFQGTHDNSVTEMVTRNSVEAKPETDFLAGSPDPVETAEATESLAAEKKASPPTESPADLFVSKDEDVPDRATASAEWNRQKEAELNQMLMKMMESKPARHRNATTAGSRNQDHSSDRRGGFYDHYKEKRDEKLRGENARKRAEKEAQFKAMQEILDKRKAEMTSKPKNVGVAAKQNSPAQAQKLRRSSSPPVLPKKEPSKPAAVRKSLPKTSPLPATRSSWPSTPSPRSIGPPSTKISSGTSTGTTPNRRKPQPTLSPTRPSPKLERSHPQQKGVKGAQTESKRNLKGGEEKKQQTVTKSGKNTKTKIAASTDDSGMVPAKPSFYSKVTKKSTVVPLESKPFLRKGTGIGPGVGPVVVKAKTSQSDESSKNSGNLIQPQENDVVAATTETITQLPPGDDVAQEPAVGDLELEILVDSNSKCENAETPEQFSVEADDSFTKTVEFPVQYPVEEIQADEDSGISSAAWVEIDHQGLPPSSDTGPSQIAMLTNVAPVSISSPRVRHSLSQMLQADSGEPEIIEWGNAENPPAMVYQKESPKGLKRLLKFARKSKGDTNATGWASPSIFSEGEDDAEEPKATSKRNADALLRKSALQAKGSGQQKTMFGESYDGGNSSKRDHTAAHELLSGQSNASNFTSQVSHKLREGQTPATATSTKATRSFFSLSTFRSSKSSETKLR
ncbi:COP1-interacting protein 7-like [Magnolia sinica]|uniref:COP1-interacting protein 7-like n=1 Tax=Magnolia sinica TaxID=86752 RepID=UPI00265B3F8B|nr:COP1-interacting protein 7-like [Magnolia sinica]XP_058075227.1 COP1-interacting protein 7-like [Magnolia sinica]XP_058075228.1 COP1-interacting protein 7-like [Magnolia sinica]